MDNTQDRVDEIQLIHPKAHRHLVQRSITGLFICAAVISASVAQAQTAIEEFNQIDDGFRIFTEETFDGNGRTCSTCHVPERAYNISPSDVRKLRGKARALVFAANVPGLENVELVRSHALFNISGNESTHDAEDVGQFGTAGHEGPVFRSSMSIHALALTSENASPAFGGTPLLPQECSDGFTAQLAQLGWSGDGSPGTPSNASVPNGCQFHHGTVDPLADGSIRGFANGAIAQHNTKSLARVEGVDFRLATQVEAEALAAFQEWLGRRTLSPEENVQQGTTNASEVDITRLSFSDNRINLGRDHFVGPPEVIAGSDPDPSAGAGCDGCHNNGGAKNAVVGGPNNFLQNININTDVELASDDIGIQVVGAALPHDEGAANSFGGADATFDEAFNIQSIIEAPRKSAFFHNHKIQGTIEDAIEHYISADFIDNGVAITTEGVMRFGNSSQSISFPDGDGIEHLGAFLRTLFAYYALRDCERLVQEAITRDGVGASIKLPVQHCIFNLDDTRKVLGGSKLRPVPYRAVITSVRGLRNDLNSLMARSDRRNRRGGGFDGTVRTLRPILDELGHLRNRIAMVENTP